MPTKEKINLILILAAIVVLLIIGVSKESFPYTITKKDTPALEETIKGSKPIEVYEPELPTPMYYLVIASFSYIENAESYCAEYGESSFQPFILPVTDGFYRVGIFSSPYKEDVELFENNLEIKPAKMWITYQ